MKKLRLDLLVLRRSFSNASLSYIDFASPLKKNGSATQLPIKKIDLGKEVPRAGLKEKL